MPCPGSSHCGSIRAARITSRQRRISLASRMASSSGVPGCGRTPISSSRCRTEGTDSDSRIATLSRATTVAGAPPGRGRPVHCGADVARGRGPRVGGLRGSAPAAPCRRGQGRPRPGSRRWLRCASPGPPPRTPRARRWVSGPGRRRGSVSPPARPCRNASARAGRCDGGLPPSWDRTRPRRTRGAGRRALLAPPAWGRLLAKTRTDGQRRPFRDGLEPVPSPFCPEGGLGKDRARVETTYP